MQEDTSTAYQDENNTNHETESQLKLHLTSNDEETDPEGAVVTQSVPEMQTIQSKEDVATGPPAPIYDTDPRILRLLAQRQPLSVNGPHSISMDRQVMWKNLCMIGPQHIECVVEMSRQK